MQHGAPKPETSLTSSLYSLATLYAKRDTVRAPFDRQIHALEYARALETAPLDAEIAALEAACKPLVMQAGHSVHAGTLTAVYQRRTYWDAKGLLAYAQEQPTVLQFQTHTPVVVFRHAPAPGQPENQP